jgi:hypothetical protein
VRRRLRDGRRPALRALALALALGGAAGCAVEPRTTAANGGPPGSSGAGRPGADAAAGPAIDPAPGSGSTGGAGGASGMGGASGNPGSPPQGAPPPAPPTVSPPASGPADAGPPRPPSAGLPCAVTISPLSPQRFTGIPAGAGYRLRVQAQAPGEFWRSRQAAWRWSVTHESDQAVPFATIDADPTVIEFPTEMTGRYTIHALIAGEVPACEARQAAYAVLPDHLFAQVRVRATPPAGRGLALFEADLQVSAGVPVTKTIDLQRGFPVTIDPQDERGFELPAFYVRIAGRTSTARFDGYVVPSRRMGFQALLELGQRYDLLLVPDRAPDGVIRAPLAFPDVRAEEFGLLSFQVDRGASLQGAVRAGERPLPGARVRLRAGMLPSTVGETGADGQYGLQVRGGAQYEVRVVPPESSGLPEAQLPQSSGVSVASSDTTLAVDFTYAAAVPVRLDLTVLDPAGVAPLPGVRVLLESEPGALPSVGSFRLPGGVQAPAPGLVRRIATTGPGGVATFGALPRARYRATLVPPDDAPGDAAITPVPDLDLASPGAAATRRSVTLGRRSRLVGQLSPASVAAGLVVKAIDTGEDGAGRTVTATVDADGRYELPTDPGRAYRLYVEPPTDRRLPRIPLESVRARATDVTVDRTLPERLALSGATLENGQAAPGVVVQVFCVGSAPICIDPETPDITNTPPLDETVSGPDGRYQLHLPDPGQQVTKR